MCRTPEFAKSAAGRMLLYYITDRRLFPGGEAGQRKLLLDKIAEAASAGVDYVQLRERDLSGRELERLTREAVAAVRDSGPTTRLLVNSRVDVALVCGADGVHLRSDDLLASEARAGAAGRERFTVAVSCHTVEEIGAAWSHGADFAVFGPVFEKEGRAGQGVTALRAACLAVPGFVVALGGVGPDNARLCREAGAAGIAGIRLFQQGPIGTLVASLRSFRKDIPKIE